MARNDVMAGTWFVLKALWQLSFDATQKMLSLLKYHLLQKFSDLFKMVLNE
jgi:hypothetical protein